MSRASMLGKISSRSMFSYDLVSATFVQPYQIRAIIFHYFFMLVIVPDHFLFSIMSRSTSTTKPQLHSHYLIPAIDIDVLAGYCRSSIAGKKDSGGASLSRITTAFQRRA